MLNILYNHYGKNFFFWKKIVFIFNCNNFELLCMNLFLLIFVGCYCCVFFFLCVYVDISFDDFCLDWNDMLYQDIDLIFLLILIL